MKKIIIIIGLLSHIIYYIYTVLSLGDYEYVGYGVGKSFAYWVYATIIAIPTLLLYLTDAVISTSKNSDAFNIFKFTIVFLSIPLFYFLGASANLISSIIWNIYFFVLFVIEIVSLFIKRTNN